MPARRWSPSRPIFEMVEAAFADDRGVNICANASVLTRVLELRDA
jgi:hypothetical protein